MNNHKITRQFCPIVNLPLFLKAADNFFVYQDYISGNLFIISPLIWDYSLF